MAVAPGDVAIPNNNNNSDNNNDSNNNNNSSSKDGGKDNNKAVNSAGYTGTGGGEGGGSGVTVAAFMSASYLPPLVRSKAKLDKFFIPHSECAWAHINDAKEILVKYGTLLMAKGRTAKLLEAG